MKTRQRKQVDDRKSKALTIETVTVWPVTVLVESPQACQRYLLPFAVRSIYVM